MLFTNVELDSGFRCSAWTQLASQSLLIPELKWEGECIEAPATLVHGNRLYMFYQGSADMGRTWYLTRTEITFENNELRLV